MPSLIHPDLLLIQQDDPTAEAFTRLLSSIGGIVRRASTMAEGIVALEQEPCLIVLDLALPDGRGLDVLKALRAKGLRSKVAVVSSVNQQNVLLSVTSLRPDAIFSKPIDFEDFIDWFNSIASDLPEICFKL